MSLRRRRNPWGQVFLVAAALGFAATTWLPWTWDPLQAYARAFFEAALVGGLADWFAVTALFRRPLGLPLPHTDLLVRRKDQLVEALPRFLAEFLEPERLEPLLRGLDWAALVREKFPPEHLDGLWDRLTVAVTTWAGTSAWQPRVLEAGLDLLRAELGRHQDSLVGPVTDLIKRHTGWKGLFVGRDTVEEGIASFLKELEAVRANPAHSLRPALQAALDQALPRLLGPLRPSRWSGGLWHRLTHDQAFQAAFNREVGEAAVKAWQAAGASQALRDGFAALLRHTDARSLANRIEASVGNDLQYIRVNGALVGGLVGLALEGLKRLGAT